MTKPPTYDRDVGKNWHLRFRLIIQELTEELELTQIQLEIAERKLKKYENNNTRSTRDRKNNNVVKLSRSISKRWDKA
jgi:predicted metal-dependent hydrolase